MIETVWNRILHAGDISGKILTLIALPSAILAAWAFYEEFGDLLSKPAVIAEVQSVGLRCAMALDVVPDDQDPETFGQQHCLASPMSSWVTLSLTNEDSIDRTLINIAFQITFPKQTGLSEKPVTWTETRVVDHVLQNDFQVDQRTPWRPMLLGAGQVQPVEIDFRPFEREHQVTYAKFRDLILSDPSPLADVELPVEILGRFSGSSDWARLGACVVPIPAETIERKKNKGPFFRSLTRRCVSQ